MRCSRPRPTPVVSSTVPTRWSSTAARSTTWPASPTTWRPTTSCSPTLTTTTTDDAPEIASGNFVVHGDDYILGGNGDDTINGETGDDRVRGSAGNDTLDGGGDWYFVRRVGETKGTATKLNAYEAQQLDEDGDVLDIYLLEQSESADSIISGSNFVPYFRDTLIYHQADFTPGTSRFTITLNDYAGTGDDIVFDNGGAGTVGVDNDGNGVIESDNVSTFQNFENIRTVSGVGLAVAGANGGQGRDTLDVNQLSDDAEVGVYYDMTGDGAGGNVYLIEDPDNKASTENNTTRLVIKVDGVENVLFGDGNDALDIDETEAAKDNVISGDLGTDVVTYRNDFADEDNEGDDEPTITIFVESSTNTDLVQSTEGRVGSVVATDTLELDRDGHACRQHRGGLPRRRHDQRRGALGRSHGQLRQRQDL